MSSVSSGTNAENAAPDLQVRMPDVVRFVRQLSHDLRNQLNAAELQCAYMKEIANDAELKEEVQRLRAMLNEMTTLLQSVTGLLVTPKPNEMPYEAAMLLDDFKNKVRAEFADKSSEIAWKVNVDGAIVSVDPQIFPQALLELVRNAFTHGRAQEPIQVNAEANGELRIIMTEPKSAFVDSTENWGREPFRKVKHGHYGLGLHRARNIIEAHRGRLDARHDSSALITTIVLPLAAK